MVDLNKSGIIEASAGTGKTYTICTIVSKIIREGRAEADQIAVVTFNRFGILPFTDVSDKSLFLIIR